MSIQHAPDYLSIGHVTIDLLPDGSPVLGGTALYAALIAARFGLRAAIFTRGNFSQHGDKIEDALRRVAGEIEIIVQDAEQPTVFTNVSVAGRREQTIHSWAGMIDMNGLPAHWRAARIVHLAPVAQEVDARQSGRLNPDYVGATPQGWMRNWTSSRTGRVKLEELRLPFETLSRINAMVLSSDEQVHARPAVEAVSARGIVAITRGSEDSLVIDRGRSIEVPSFPVKAVDDTGAGDIFAATLFIQRAEQQPTLAAARAAAAAAALRVQGQGLDSIPTRTAVERFLARHELAPTLRLRGR